MKTRLLSLLLLVAALCAGGSSAHAQGGSWLDQLGISAPEGSGEAPIGEVSMNFDDATIDVSFFAHEDFGWGLYTFENIGRDLRSLWDATHAVVGGLGEAPLVEVVAVGLPPLFVIVLLGFAVFYDRRVRRGLFDMAEQLRLDDERPPWLQTLEIGRAHV